MADYLTKKCNFDPLYVVSAFQIEGYYDDFQLETLQADSTKRDVIKGRRPQCYVNPVTGNFMYELILLPTHGFFLENKPLPTNTEVMLTLHRLSHEFSTLFVGSKDDKKLPEGSCLKITDAYALVEYVSSPSLRNYFSRIRSKPISYKYNDTLVTTMDLPIGRKNVHLHNITGGNTPAYIFFSLIQTKALNGTDEMESTNFAFNRDLTSVNVLLNGQSLNGYPQVRAYLLRMIKFNLRKLQTSIQFYHISNSRTHLEKFLSQISDLCSQWNTTRATQFSAMNLRVKRSHKAGSRLLSTSMSRWK